MSAALLSVQGLAVHFPIAAGGLLRRRYLPLKAVVRPELVLIAEQAGDLAGYFFVLPDLLQAKRGRPVETILLKTMAVRPELGGFGLGGWLMAQSHDTGRRFGYRRAIHALDAAP